MGPAAAAPLSPSLSDGASAVAVLPWRDQLAKRLTTVLIATAATTAAAMWLLIESLAPRVALVCLAVVAVLVLALARRRSRHGGAPVPLLMATLLAIVMGGLCFAGLLAGPALAAAATTIVAGLFLGPRGFLLAVGLQIVGAGLVAWAMCTGRLAPPPAVDVSFTSARVWVRSGLVVSLLMTVCVVLVRGVVHRLEAALEHARAEVARRELAERERMAAQDAVLQAQKLEAVAQVAAGIAHDFNNLLAVVGSKTEQVLRRLPAESIDRRDLEIVSDVVAGGAGLIRRLLLFSRRQVVRAEVIPLHPRLRGLERLLGTLVGANVSLAWRLSDEPLGVWLDTSQLEQVVMNLVLNARDAMPEGGTITISTRVARDEHGARDLVVLQIADTGAGMDAATLARAFDPLFTTKPVGLGTGLGLSTVKQIARQAGGDAHLDSTPGRGTSVEVHLPRATLPATAAPRAVAPAGPVAAAPGTRPVVLLVEDEPHLRRALAGFLADASLEVELAGDGAAALAQTASLARLDAVVCDVSMPGMNGVELVRRLRAARAGLPALIMSGYMGPDIELAALGAPPVHFLAKPFGPEKLLEEVAAMLEHRPASA